MPEAQVGEGLWVVWPASASEQDGVVHLDVVHLHGGEHGVVVFDEVESR